MEKEIVEKIKRFVELSGKFSKSEDDVFVEKVGNNNFAYTTISYNYDCIISNSRTRAENILAEAEIKAQLSREFDEYYRLKESLKGYFDALNKVID